MDTSIATDVALDANSSMDATANSSENEEPPVIDGWLWISPVEAYWVGE